MALNGMGLGFLFTATDMASGVMQNINKNFKGLEDAAGQTIDGLDGMVSKLGTSLAGIAISVGGLTAAFGLANKAGEFEQALANVGAVTKATKEEMKLLEAAAMKAGKETQFSPTAAVQGLNEIGQAGYDTKESIELLTPVLNLAAGSLGDLSPAEAAGLATQGLKAFGIEAKDAGLMVDQLLQSANAFAVKPKDLALGLGTAASGAQTLNQSLTDTVIAFGLIKNVVPGTEKSATSLKVMMEQLAKPKIAAALRAQGVAVADADGNFRRMFDILKDLQPVLAKMSETEGKAFMMKIFGTEGLTGANAIFAQLNTGIKGMDGHIRKGSEAIDELQRSFRGAEGAAKDFKDRTLATFEGQKTLFGGSMETLAIQLGKPFKEVFTPVVTAATDAVNGLIAALDLLPDSFKNSIAALTVISLVLLGIVSVVSLIVAAWPLITIGWGLFTAALETVMAAIGAALLSIWPLILAAVLLGGVIYAVSQAIKKNINGIGTAWDRLGTAVSAVVERASVVWQTFTDYLSATWEAFSEGFLDELEPMFDMFGLLFDTLADAIGGFGNNMNDVSTGPGEEFKAFLNGVGHIFGIIFRAIGGVVVVVGFLVAALIKVFDWLKAIIDAFGEIKTGFRVLGMFGFKTTDTVSGTRGMEIPKEQAKERLAKDKRSYSERSAVGPNATQEEMQADLADRMKMAEDDRLHAKLKPATASSLGLEAFKFKGNDAYNMDFDKMAEAMVKAGEKRPLSVNLNVDGEKLAASIQKAGRAHAARAGGKDADEP
jgi:TP901 family phage tail tape measure protein